MTQYMFRSNFCEFGGMGVTRVFALDWPMETNAYLWPSDVIHQAARARAGSNGDQISPETVSKRMNNRPSSNLTSILSFAYADAIHSSKCSELW